MSQCIDMNTCAINFETDENHNVPHCSVQFASSMTKKLDDNSSFDQPISSDLLLQILSRVQFEHNYCLTNDVCSVLSHLLIKSIAFLKNYFLYRNPQIIIVKTKEICYRKNQRKLNIKVGYRQIEKFFFLNLIL